MNTIPSKLYIFVCVIILHTNLFSNPSDHYITNAMDAAIFTIVATIINKYTIQSNTHLNVSESLAYGISSWLCGELLEAIYKKIYKELSGRNLRETLGTTNLFALEFDYQRALRRTITLIPLYFSLYLRETGITSHN